MLNMFSSLVAWDRFTINFMYVCVVFDWGDGMAVDMYGDGVERLSRINSLQWWS